MRSLLLVLAFLCSPVRAGQAVSPPSATSADSFEFVVYGDNRAGDEGVCQGNAVHLSLIQRIAKENAAFVVNTGDMVTGYSSSTNWVAKGSCTAPDSHGSLKEQIQPLNSMAPGPGLPGYFIPVVGNHDANWKQKWYPDRYGNGICDVFGVRKYVPNHTRAPYHDGKRAKRLSDADFYRLICATRDLGGYPNYFYYSFRYRNSAFLVLRLESDYSDFQTCNSCGKDKKNYDDYHGIHQLDWLRWELARAKGDPVVKNIFVFLHAPLFSSAWGHPNNASWRTLAREFTGSGVRMVFSGHNHVFERSFPVVVDAQHPEGVRDDDRGTVYLTTGGGGSPLHGFDSRKWFSAAGLKAFHYVRVSVRGSAVSTEAVGVDGKVLDRSTR